MRYASDRPDGEGRMTHLSDLENGRREIGLLMIERLANAFGVPPADLLK